MRERWRFRSCSGVPSKNKAQGSLMESSQVPDRRPSSRKMLSYVPFYHGSIPKLMGIKIYTKEAVSRRSYILVRTLFSGVNKLMRSRVSRTVRGSKKLY